jgi:hypothetical protein
MHPARIDEMRQHAVSEAGHVELVVDRLLDLSLPVGALRNAVLHLFGKAELRLEAGERCFAAGVETLGVTKADVLIAPAAPRRELLLDLGEGGRAGHVHVGHGSSSWM